MSRLRPRGIRARLFAILLLAIAGGVGVGAMAWYLSIRPALVRAVAETQREIVRRVADQIDNFVEGQAGQLISAADIGRFWEEDRARQRQALYRLLKLAPAVNEVAVVDRGGREVLRLSRTRVFIEAQGNAGGAADWFPPAMKGEVYLGNVYHDRTAEPFMTIAVPIKFTVTDIRGVLVAEVTLKSLWDAIAHIPVGESGHAFVVDRRGRLIAHRNYSKVLLHKELTHVDGVREFLASPQRHKSFGQVVKGESGGDVLTTFAVVPRTGWGVIVEEPAITALAQARRVERLALFLVLAGVGAALGLSYASSRRIVRPLRLLQEGAARLSRGDLDHRLAIATGDEIEVLGRQFNQMADQLEASHRDLERKVAEKTRDLAGLYALTGPISQASELRRILDDAVVKIMDVTGVEAASIRFLEETAGRFRYASYRGFPEAYVQALSDLKRHNPAAAEVLETGQPIFAEDLGRHPTFAVGLLLSHGFRSAAYLPLVASNGVVGLMTLASRKEGALHPGQAEFLTIIAHQISIAVENARLFQQEQERRQQLEAVRVVAEEVTRELDLPTLLGLILRRAIELVGAAGGTIRLWDEATQMLVAQAWHGVEERMRETPLRLGQRIPGIVAQRRQGMLVNDYRTSPDADPLFLERTGTTAVLSEPLLYRDGLVGVITVRHEGRTFTDRDRETLALFAAQGAIAIENARLYTEAHARLETIQRQHASAQALLEVSQALTGTLDLETVLDLIVDKVLAATAAEACGITQIRAGRDLEYVRTKGFPGPLERGTVFPRGEGLIGRCLEVQRTVWSRDILDDPTIRYNPEMRARAEAAGVRGALAVPIAISREPYGVLFIGHGGPHDHTPGEIAFAEALAAQAAIAIENARLFEDLGRSHAQLARHKEQLHELYRLGLTMQTALPLQERLGLVLRGVHGVLGFDRIAIFMPDRQGEMLECQAAFGDLADPVERLRLPLGPEGGILARAFQEGREIVWTGQGELPPDLHLRPPYSQLETLHSRSFVIFPLVSRDGVIGVLGADNKASQRPLPEETLSLLRPFAAQAAIAIENARLYEHVAAHAQTLEQRVQERTTELEAANRAKSEFLSRMSHELRTPLNAILGFAQLLQMDAVTPEQRESVEHILNGGRHLLALINEVLDIARIETGRLHLSPEPVPVADLLRETVDLVRPIAAHRSLRLELALPPGGDRHVRADRQRLKQVLLNLLSNAIKYNHDEGTVTVAYTETSGDRARLTVRDTGPGIPPEKLGRLFMPFDRLGAEHSGVAGVGLGLSLSKCLAEAMGGTLGVESAVDQGSTFWVELPLEEGPAEGLERLERRAPASLGSPDTTGTILYIEDNLSNLQLIERILAGRPRVRLLPAMQGRLGVDLAHEHRPDLILLDLHLPDIPGEEVLRRLRADPRTQSIPVAVISADASPGQIERLRAAGVHQYITKPLDVRQLLEVVDEMLRGGGG